MFTIYHAVSLVAAVVFGIAIGYATGTADGYEQGVIETEKRIRAERRRSREEAAR